MTFAARALLFVGAASSFACLLGCTAALSRMMRAFARSGSGPPSFKRLVLVLVRAPGT